MKRLTHITIILASLLSALGTYAQEIIVPNKAQRQWADAEIGVLIHFDMPTFKEDYNFRLWGTHPDVSAFNPTELNTDQWLEAASRIGAKYAVLVAKHCSGFSLWPTEAHPYSVKNCPWQNGKGDIVRDFVASCKKYGIKPGIYASTTANGYCYVDNPGLVQPGSPFTQEEYNAIVKKQLTELWSNYGPIFEIWFDGGVLSPEKGGWDVLSLAKRLQPDAIAFQGPFGHDKLIRWVGNEEGTAPDPCWATADSTTNSDGVKAITGLNGNPYGKFWCPGESDFTLRYNSSYQGGWFWAKDQDDQMFSVKELMHKYETSVGRNTNMLLGIVIDDRGLVPEADMCRLAEFGKEIERQFGHPVAHRSGKGRQLILKLGKASAIDHVVIQEDITYGERVLEYILEGKDINGKWNELSRGESIGHKRIIRFGAQRLSQIRLTVTRCKAEPVIQNLSAFAKEEDCGQQKQKDEFEISIREMNPRGFPSQYVTPGYSIALSNDSVRMYLPYIGEVYQPDFGNNSLDGTLAVCGFSSASGKKSRKEISFRCRKGFIEYVFNITIFPGGKAYVFLQPSNAQPISYEGELKDSQS